MYMCECVLICECLPAHITFRIHPDDSGLLRHARLCICVDMHTHRWSNRTKTKGTEQIMRTISVQMGREKKWKTVVEWRRRVIVWEIHSIFEPPAFRMSPSSKMNGAWEKSTAELMACVPKTHVGELTIVTARTRLQPNILFGAIGAGTKRRS